MKQRNNINAIKCGVNVFDWRSHYGQPNPNPCWNRKANHVQAEGHPRIRGSFPPFPESSYSLPYEATEICTSYLASLVQIWAAYAKLLDQGQIRMWPALLQLILHLPKPNSHPLPWNIHSGTLSCHIFPVPPGAALTCADFWSSTASSQVFTNVPIL